MMIMILRIGILQYRRSAAANEDTGTNSDRRVGTGTGIVSAVSFMYSTSAACVCTAAVCRIQRKRVTDDEYQIPRKRTLQRKCETQDRRFRVVKTLLYRYDMYRYEPAGNSHPEKSAQKKSKWVCDVCMLQQHSGRFLSRFVIYVDGFTFTSRSHAVSLHNHESSSPSPPRSPSSKSPLIPLRLSIHNISSGSSTVGL